MLPVNCCVPQLLFSGGKDYATTCCPHPLGSPVKPALRSEGPSPAPQCRSFGMLRHGGESAVPLGCTSSRANRGEDLLDTSMPPPAKCRSGVGERGRAPRRFNQGYLRTTHPVTFPSCDFCAAAPPLFQHLHRAGVQGVGVRLHTSWVPRRLHSSSSKESALAKLGTHTRAPG